MRRWVAVSVLCALGSAARAEPVDARDPLLAVVHSDPLEVARVVARMGDAAVLARLGEDTPGEVRLMAIRATPWMRAPERSLGPLSALVTSRDPALAPAAARALRRIAGELTFDALSAREFALEDLQPVVQTLREASQVAWLRADLRLAAQQALARLQDMLPDES